MANLDATGPKGEGPKTGKQMGNCSGNKKNKKSKKENDVTNNQGEKMRCRHRGGGAGNGKGSGNQGRRNNMAAQGNGQGMGNKHRYRRQSEGNESLENMTSDEEMKFISAQKEEMLQAITHIDNRILELSEAGKA